MTMPPNVLGDVHGMSWGTSQASDWPGHVHGELERPSRTYPGQTAQVTAVVTAVRPARIPWGESAPGYGKRPARRPVGGSAAGRFLRPGPGGPGSELQELQVRPRSVAAQRASTGTKSRST